MKKEVLVTGSKRDAADAGTTPGDGAPVGVASVKYSVLRSNVVRVVLSKRVCSSRTSETELVHE